MVQMVWIGWGVLADWGETSAATVDQPSSKQAGIAVEMLGTSNWVNTECLETEWGQMIYNIPEALQIFIKCNLT